MEPEVRESLGKLPDGFVTYWLRRFPLLLPHVWLQMQQFRHEDILQGYYPHSFTFLREDVLELTDDKYECDIPIQMCSPEKNELFVKSRVYKEESEDTFRKEESPRRRANWRNDMQVFRSKDDVRLRDRNLKREKVKEEMPIWRIPPQ